MSIFLKCLDSFLKVKELTLHKSKIIPCYLGFLIAGLIRCSKRYQDAMMRAREKMQYSLDEQTAIHQTKVKR